jgi:hypothetical protein
MLRARLATWHLVTLFAVTALVGLWVRAWQLAGTQAMMWQDSTDYLTSSRAPWFSLELWAGPRAPAVPVLLKLTSGDGQNAMALQAIVAALCWAGLATAIAAALPAGWRRWAAAGLVVGVSLTQRTTMWDQSLLSETLALAFLALVLAVLLQFARHPTPGWGAALVGTSALWVSVRDAPAVALLAGVVVLQVVLISGRPHAPRQRKVLALAAAGLAVVAVLTLLAAQHGRRSAVPLEHVFAVRVLPYPDRVDWFADHGMPLADEIAALGPPVHPVPTGPPVVGVPEDPPFDRWHDWVRTSGQRTFVLWMVTHPGYVANEPFEEPERAYNNAEGDLEFYRLPDYQAVPLLGVLSVGTAWLAPLGLFVLAALIWFDRQRSPLVLGAVAMVATAVPHGVMAWHSDGMETARHLVVPGMQVRLAVVLLAVGLLTRPRGETGETGETERSQGVPVTGAMGTVAESTLAPIDPVDHDVMDQNSDSRRQVLEDKL